MITDFDSQFPSSELITDEKVVIDKVATFDSDYKSGWIMGLTDNQILGNTNANLGIWSAAGKSGTRYNVISAGLPTTGQILLDQRTGRLSADSSITVYCRYNWFGRISHWWEHGPKIVSLLGGMIDSASEEVLLDEPLEFPEAFVGMSITTAENVEADLEINLRKTVGGSDIESLTVSNGSRSAFGMFSERRFFAADEAIVLVSSISTGANAISPIITLIRG